MRDYGRIYGTFWTSDDIRPLTDQGKLLAAHLLTCSHGTIAGVFYLPEAYVAEDLGWSAETVSKAFLELSDSGFTKHCPITRWVWVCKHLEWNEPENPNQWKAVRKMAERVPSKCCWLSEFEQSLNPSRTVPKPPDKGSGTPSGAAETVPESVSVSVSETVAVTEPVTKTCPPPGAANEAVPTVFAHWQREWNHPTSKLDAKRRKRIEARLKDFTADQLCDAVSGFKHSAWHTGTDPKGNGTVYDSLDTLLRDTAQVETGLRLFAHPPRPPPKPETAHDRMNRMLNGTDDSRVIDHDPEFPALPGH